MSNPLNLLAGKKYKVIQEFLDYDQAVHKIGESWTFLRTNFVPYNDGLTLHVSPGDLLPEKIYRLQWRAEGQAEIIANFGSYVESC